METTAQVVGETESPFGVTEETIPAPQTTYGTARVHHTPAVLGIRMRGDQVDVVGLYDENHYVIKTAEGYGLVRREFIRMEAEPVYETWTGYALWNAELYTDLYLIGDPAQKLKTNTKVEVLEDLGYCYVVQVEQTVGFMKQDQISKWWISTGGTSGSSESSAPAGQDGGEISLHFNGSIQLLSAIAQTGEVSGTGTILADGTEVILGYFARGEEIPVILEEGFAENKAGFCTIYLDGLYAWVNEKFVCMDTETYAQWDGYAQWSALVYDNYHMLGSPKDRLDTNTKVRVVEELENCYFVEIEGVPGFMEKDMVRKAHITNGGSSGSTGSNSSSTGGNGSTGGSSGSSSGGDPEWTPPIL